VRTLNRRLRDLRQIASGLKRSRMTPLQVCEAIIERRLTTREARTFFSDLPHDERHYWIASLYALLMPDVLRRRLAAYFTPPHLAHYAIGALVEAGIKPGRDRILDPASGGAAFLVPLVAYIAGHGRQRGRSASRIIRSINDTLRGVERASVAAWQRCSLACGQRAGRAGDLARIGDPQPLVRLRGPGESYSDVILLMAEFERAGGALKGSPERTTDRSSRQPWSEEWRSD
jgi:hypothetical protein